ncbi:MAG: GAF domain-containing protein, partial [Anaerolineales bacterium]|nr:GAF domain-containing protein [Anaerolineales bacterium]
MTWIFHPVLLFPLVSAFLGIWLTRWFWRYRSQPRWSSFSFVMVAATVWAGANFLELGATGLVEKILWLKIEYLGVLLLPAAWLIFALDYRGQTCRRSLCFLLAIEPIVIWILLLTNDFHHWFIREFGLRKVGELVVWQNVAGPAYWVNVFYSYGLLIVGSLLLLSHRPFLRLLYGKREALLILGLIFPWFGNVLYVFYDWPLPGVDLTPFFLVLSGVVFRLGAQLPASSSFQPAPLLSTEDLSAWRSHVLDLILRGIFLLWLLTLPAALYNVWEAYQAEAVSYPERVLTAWGTVVVYIGTTLLVAFITFRRRLSYRLRAGIFLGVLYLAGFIGLALASLSGDGRIFLFAFIVLAAVFFNLRIGWLAAIVSLVTIVGMARLQITGIVVVPPERQINSTDVSAWVSGTLVFSFLSLAALISVSYLLRLWENSYKDLQNAWAREHKLAQIVRMREDITRLIVREADVQRLLQQTCERLVAGRGYSMAWAGLVEPDRATLRAVASAGAVCFGKKLNSGQTLPVNEIPCVRRAFQEGQPFLLCQDQLCLTCPLHEDGPQGVSLVLPLVNQRVNLGIVVVENHGQNGFFEQTEIGLLGELADDLAHALATLRAAEQQKILAEISNGLLFARDEDMLWMEVIAAVKRVLNAERVAIYMYDRATDTLSCKHWHGLSYDYIQEINRRFREVPGSKMLRTQRPVVVEDIETDPATVPLRERMRREGFCSYAVFPLYTSKGLQGAFVAYRNTPSVFTSSDMAAGETLVRMIGLALENMSLYAEARRKASELAALYAAAQDMASSLLDSQALLQTLVRHVTEALHATSAYIST